MGPSAARRGGTSLFSKGRDPRRQPCSWRERSARRYCPPPTPWDGETAALLSGRAGLRVVLRRDTEAGTELTLLDLDPDGTPVRAPVVLPPGALLAPSPDGDRLAVAWQEPRERVGDGERRKAQWGGVASRRAT